MLNFIERTNAILTLSLKIKSQFFVNFTTFLNNITQILDFVMVSRLALEINLFKNCKLIFQSTSNRLRLLVCCSRLFELLLCLLEIFCDRFVVFCIAVKITLAFVVVSDNQIRLCLQFTSFLNCFSLTCYGMVQLTNLVLKLIIFSFKECRSPWSFF